MAKKLTATSLSIKKTPIPTNIRRRMRSKVGKKYKKGISDFIATLFQINETLAKSKKMTDWEIARQIVAEYKAFPDIVAKYTPEAMEDFNQIAKVRSEYNYGRLSGPPPEDALVSFPYNEDGLAVNIRYTIPKPLTEKQKDDFRKKIANVRERYYKKRMEQ